jgi:hypothetical protein
MATNVATTTSTTRSDMGDTGTYSSLTGFLKDVFLPGLTDTIFKDKQLLSVFQPVIVEISGEGRRFVVAWDTQAAGGIGSISEGGDFVSNVAIGGVQGYDSMKTDNLYFSLSGPVTRQIHEGEGSYVDPVGKTLQSILEMYQMDVTRKLFGSGNAALAKWLSGSTTTQTISGPAFTDTYWLNKGMNINVYAPATGLEVAIDNGSTFNASISSMSPGNKRIGSSSTIVTDASYSAGGLTAGDIICRRDSYNTSGVCLEQNGLCNLVSTGAAESYTNGFYYSMSAYDCFKYAWPCTSSGRDKTSGYTYLASQEYNVNGVLTEDALLTSIAENKAQFRGKPNMLICSSRAFIKYFGQNKDDRRFYTMDAMDWVGGVKGLGIQLGQTKLMLSPMDGCPSNYGFMINTADFAIARPQGQSAFGPVWLTGEGGSIIKQKEGSDAKFAAAVHDWQFVCKDPGAQCKLVGITEV